MTLLRKAVLLGVVALIAAPLAMAQNIQINEIRIDQPSGDVDEYFELIGAPGASLDGYFYIVIGDGAGASGVVESITDLTGNVIPADGVFLCAESTPMPNSGAVPDLVASLGFENSDNVTHLLVSGFTGASQDDLDTNDDCSLDSTPWSAEHDRIALVEEDNPAAGTECHYGPPQVGPDGTFVPGHVFRCDNNTWVIGGFTVGTDDTPGVANSNCPVPVRESTWGAIKSQYKTLED